ncbi:MAG: hypothetical protein IT230_14305 [Flavobacteriales bacterium]|nr:hypothetical protein [Flavobacteriales bacterium]
MIDVPVHAHGLGRKNHRTVTNPEPPQQPHDSFIASFDLQYQNTLGTNSPAAPVRNLVVNPLPAEGQWAVHFPELGDWTVIAYYAAGQKVGAWHASGTALVVDLTARPQGLYLLVASTPPGTRYSAKIVRP